VCDTRLAQFIGGLQHQLPSMFDAPDPVASVRSFVDGMREHVGFAAAGRQTVENRTRSLGVSGS
jgi:hypothetical protein